ncbi:MAG TPA: hypothetical protein PKN80_05165, partial [bacterium]|nr:hypothetical protein [bacterium]
MADFETSVRYLKGVGEQRAHLLEKIGVRILFDLVYYFPRRYEDRKKITPVAETVPGQPATICATVLTSGSKSGWRGKQIFTAALSDDTGLIYATFFNQGYLKDVLVPGCRVLLSGRPSIYQGEKSMIHPVFEVLKEGTGRPTEAGRIVALYRPPEGLSQRAFHLIMLSALRELGSEVKEVVPFAERQRLNLGNLRHALKNIHFPVSETDLRKAREYLIFEEFFLLAAALRKRRLDSRGVAGGPGPEGPAGGDPAAFISGFQALLSFPLP